MEMGSARGYHKKAQNIAGCGRKGRRSNTEANISFRVSDLSEVLSSPLETHLTQPAAGYSQGRNESMLDSGLWDVQHNDVERGTDGGRGGVPLQQSPRKSGLTASTAPPN